MTALKKSSTALNVATSVKDETALEAQPALLRVPTLSRLGMQSFCPFSRSVNS